MFVFYAEYGDAVASVELRDGDYVVSFTPDWRRPSGEPDEYADTVSEAISLALSKLGLSNRQLTTG